MADEPITVRAVRADEAGPLRALRLAALAADPAAFGATLADELVRPAAFWASWAERSAAGEHQRTWVAEAADGELLGLALVRAADRARAEGRAEATAPGAAPASGVAVLNAMWVDPAVRGGGVADRLVAACAGWARARGFVRLELGALEDNLRALAFYRRCGFAEGGRVRVDHRGRVMDAVRLVLPLGGV